MTEGQSLQFLKTRQRDAWFVIRGFVYQVELTVDRWLSLSSPELLEIESGGEDIDLIRPMLDGDTAAYARLLEQVKHRERHLTLRSEEAISAIASFIEHREANPTLELSFRYVTNATVGHEQDTPLTGDLGGIEAWEGLRRGDHSLDVTSVLQAIRAFILSTHRPSALATKTYQRLLDFVRESGDESILDLVRHFEWSTAVAEGDSLRAKLVDELVTRQLVCDDEQAQQAYLRLVYHVITLLSQGGKKVLTCEDRAQICALQDLSASEQVSFQSVLKFIDTMGIADAVRTHALETRRNSIALVATNRALEATNELLKKIADNGRVNGALPISPVPALQATTARANAGTAGEAKRLLAESTSEYLRGFIRRSESLAREALDLDPHNSEIVVRLSLALLRKGEYAKVEQLLAADASAKTDSMVLVHAECVWRQQDYELAIRILQQIKCDTLADKHYQLGMCYLYRWRAEGRKREADFVRAQGKLAEAYKLQRDEGKRKFWIMVNLAIVRAVRGDRDFALEDEATLAINDAMVEFPFKSTVRIYRLLLRILAGDEPGLHHLVRDDIQQCSQIMELPADLFETMEGRIDLIASDQALRQRYKKIVCDWAANFIVLA